MQARELIEPEEEAMPAACSVGSVCTLSSPTSTAAATSGEHRIAVLLKVEPPKGYLAAQQWVRENYELYDKCDARMSVSGQNPHVTLIWDLSTTSGLDDAVAKITRAHESFSKIGTGISMHPSAAPTREFSTHHGVESNQMKGWCFGHCAIPVSNSPPDPNPEL